LRSSRGGNNLPDPLMLSGDLSPQQNGMLDFRFLWQAA
jgi:hypothetical protein